MLVMHDKSTEEMRKAMRIIKKENAHAFKLNANEERKIRRELDTMRSNKSLGLTKSQSVTASIEFKRSRQQH